MSIYISNSDNVIDSRDVISRTEELLSQLTDEYEEQDTTLSFEYWLQDENNSGEPDDVVEYRQLAELVEQCGNCADWNYGATLIRESYFVEYIEELIDDCYELPEELQSGRKGGQWPWCHMSIDYGAAADEASQDYETVIFDGVEYLIRA